jgi:hypothetical protein
MATTQCWTKYQFVEHAASSLEFQWSCAQVAADFERIDRLAEHGTCFKTRPQAEPKSGLPMFGAQFPV